LVELVVVVTPNKVVTVLPFKMEKTTPVVAVEVELPCDLTTVAMAVQVSSSSAIPQDNLPNLV
jgi:hypothetical protein